MWAVLISSILVLSASAIKIDKEFLLGFETGLMQRTNENLFEEFNCQVAEGEPNVIRQISGTIEKFKMFS